MLKNLIAAILGLALVAACAPSAGSVETAIAQTQAAQPTSTPTLKLTATSTLEPSATYTPRPTATTKPTVTETVAPSDTPEGAIDKFALNHTTTAESGGIQIEVARVAFFTRDAMAALQGGSDLVNSRMFTGTVTIGELILKITNTTDKVLKLYPDQGTVVIGNEQVDLVNYSTALTGRDDISGDIFPGVTKLGGFYFGLHRTQIDAITSALYVFDAAVDAKFNKLGDDFEIVLDLSNHEFQPFEDALK